MPLSIKREAHKPLHSKESDPKKPVQLISPDLAIKISTLSIALLPAILGFAFIQLGIIYTGGLRPVVFEISWITLAFLIITTSIASGTPVIDEVKHFPRTYMVVFLLFVGIWVYTSTLVAPSSSLANYYLGLGTTAILLGLAIAALRRQAGTSFATKLSWALFVAMLLHAPFWVWLYLLEGQNSDFKWLYRLPGYPGLRMYGYSVEVGIAAGLGLFFLSGKQKKQSRIWLTFGISLLWMLLFWGGGRGAFFALVGTVALLFFVVPNFAKTMWLFCISTITLGTALSIMLPKPSGAYGIMSRINQTFNSGSIDEISTNRLSIWSDAYEIFLNRPFLGHGPAQYRILTSDPDLMIHDQTHNILLESLVSFGIIGTVCLMFLLGKIWLGALLRLRSPHSISSIPVFLVATTLLAHGLFSGTFFHIHSMFIIAISLGLLLPFNRADKKTPT